MKRSFCCIRTHREKNFPLHLAVLEKLTPLIFALDHVNYSRWMPVHIRDMKCLPNLTKDDFEKQCHWVFSKTNKFSAIPIDQAHEQENANVESSGGCIGLTENPVERWMLSGQSWPDCRGNLRKSTFLMLIQRT